MLTEDASLADALSAPECASATAASTAVVVRAERGAWEPPGSACRPNGLGLLVLSGLIVRRVAHGDRSCAELLAPGDVLRPWQAEAGDGFVELTVGWQVLSDVRLAVLDADWAARMATWPAVACEISDRLLARSRRLVAAAAINQHRRLSHRLWLFLWMVAERCGTVRPDGIHLQLPLTHETLGQFVGAARPSVCTAVAALVDARRLRREGDRWILIGPPPASASEPFGTRVDVAPMRAASPGVSSPPASSVPT